MRLYGSALRSKRWRDLDIAMQWDDTILHAGGPAWLWLCHAFSVAASQEVGAPVEVHLHTDPQQAHHLVLATSHKLNLTVAEAEGHVFTEAEASAVKAMNDKHLASLAEAEEKA